MSRLSFSFNNDIYNELIDEIRWSYERFDDFIIAADIMAKNEHKNINNKIDEWNEKYPNHEISGFETQEDDYIRFLSFANHIDFAIMILAYSTFEINLKKICCVISNDNLSKLVPDDFAGKGILQSKIFLEKVLLFDFNSIKDEWEIIILYQYMRNKIVHSNGRIDVKATSKLSDLSKVKRIEQLELGTISDDGQINLFKEDIRKFTKTATDVMVTILETLAEKKVIQKHSPTSAEMRTLAQK